MQLLLERGADINAKERHTVSPLYFLVSSGASSIIEWFLDAGACAQASDNFGVTVLHLAVRRGRTKTVEALLRHGAQVNSKDVYDETPLHYAVMKEVDVEIFLLLLKWGAAVNVVNRFAVTPLHCAVEKGNSNIADLLLGHGANIHARCDPLLVPFVAGDYDDDVDFYNLIENGFDYLEQHDGIDGETPLEIAQRKYPNSELVDILEEEEEEDSIVAATKSNEDKT